MKPTFQELLQRSLAHLDSMKDLPYEVEVRISTAPNCCDGCKKLAERIYTLEEAYRLMPVPNKQCNKEGYHFCRCRYIATAKRDAEGRLILKNVPAESEPVPQRRQRKPYNPNTKYGRRKLREERAEYRASLSPGERKEYDAQQVVIYILIIAVICVVLYLIGGERAVTKWFQR